MDEPQTTDEDLPPFIPWNDDRRSWSSKLEELWQMNAAPYEWRPPTGKGMDGAGWRRIDTLYKPVPQGYRGWSCGTDANGECLCGEPEGVNPSMAACPHAVLVPDVQETTDPARRIAIELMNKHFPGEEDSLDAFFTDLVRALKRIRLEGCGLAWQDTNHAWQKWLDENIPDWDTMAGIDLKKLPRMPE